MYIHIYFYTLYYSRLIFELGLFQSFFFKISGYFRTRVIFELGLFSRVYGIFIIIVFYRFPIVPKKPFNNLTLAFTFVVHNQVGLFEILLHMVFRPYHAYCIYVGQNTPKYIRKAMHNLVNCYQQLFPNTLIFLASKVNKIKWGDFSLLQADLQCMEDLLERKSQ